MKTCYCPSCGTINHFKNKRCMKCDSKLKPYDSDLIKLISDQAEGDIRGGIVSLILEFLKAHTYGIVFSITLVAVIVPNIALASKKTTIVDKKPDILLTNQCISKKFAHDYTYVYETNDECIKEGYNAFYKITEHVNENVFTFACDEIKDECGKTWYGVSFNIYDSVEDQIKKVYY